MALSLRSAPAELGSRARDPAASSLRPAIAVDRQSRKRPSRIWEPGSATGITPTTDFGLRQVTRGFATRSRYFLIYIPIEDIVPYSSSYRYLRPQSVILGLTPVSDYT